MTLDNEAILARFEAEHYARNSVSRARRREGLKELRDLAANLDGRTLVEVTPSDLMAWQARLLERGLVPNTVRNRETMVRAFFAWAALSGLLSFEALARIKSVPAVRGAEKRPKPKPYKRADIEAFRIALAAMYPLCPTTGAGSRSLAPYFRGQTGFRKHVWRHATRLQIEAQVSLALEEGLRRIELYTLKIAHMHPDNAAVLVLGAKGKPGEERWREVPFTEHSRRCVQEWLDFRRLLAPEHEHPWLFLRTRNPTGPQTLKQLKHSLLPVGEWRWHRFRHTFATEYLRAGMPLEKVQLMMGHASLQQTLSYAEIVNADVQAEANRTHDAFARNLGLAA